MARGRKRERGFSALTTHKHLATVWQLCLIADLKQRQLHSMGRERERERGREREGEQSPQLVIPRTRLALDERAKMLICFDNCKNHKINELGIYCFTSRKLTLNRIE